MGKKAKLSRPADGKAIPPRGPGAVSKARKPTGTLESEEADDIDAIFLNARKSDKGKVDGTGVPDNVTSSKKEQQVEKVVAGHKEDIFGEQSSRNRKRTEEGYCIYSEDELKLNKNTGDTDLCPFDCNCCF